MNKRAEFVQQILDKFYPEPSIPLQHKNPYTLLISVVLSAQCTDQRVNLVTPTLFLRADSPDKMVQLKVEEIQKLIRSCGLSSTKSKAIWNLSHILLQSYAGEVPQTFEELEALPGVGHKTASVVMAQAFHRPAFAVDTHIHRCAARWGLSDGRSVKKTEADLKALFSEKDWNRLHLQIIYFARKYCPAKRHNVLACPICSQLANPSHDGKAARNLSL